MRLSVKGCRILYIQYKYTQLFYIQRGPIRTAQCEERNVYLVDTVSQKTHWFCLLRRLSITVITVMADIVNLEKLELTIIAIKQ